MGDLANGVSAIRVAGGRGEYYAASSGRGSIDDEGQREREAPYHEASFNSDDDEDAEEQPYRPSAKALGKRKVEVDPYERREFFFL